MCSLATLFAISVAAQQPASPATNSFNALGSACEGAWQEIQSANKSLQFMPQRSLTRAERVRLSCLLDAIGHTTFDARDPQFNAFLATEATWLTVSAYGPAAYDFFAEQLTAPLAQPVVRGLQTVLLERGHPEAFRRYFAEHRSQVTAGSPAEKPSHNVYVLFEPLIARGTCSSGQEAERDARYVRDSARSLRATIGRITRSEATIGAVTPR